MPKHTANISLICTLTIMVVLLAGCHDLASMSKYDQAYDIVRTAVPFAENGSVELSSSKIFLKGTDEYGRQLFVYRYFSSILNERIDIWLICQQTDTWDMNGNGDRFAYYYPNDCYLILPQDSKPEEKVLTAFKEANDWEKPLCEDKFVSVQFVYQTNRRDVIEYDESIVSKCREHLDLTSIDNFLCDKLELNGKGQQLLLARRYTDKNQNGEIHARHECYLFLYDTESEVVLAAKEVPSLLIELDGDISEIGSFISSFKDEVGF